MKTSIGAKTALYPTPVLIVGTYDVAGRPNAMTVAWGGICCSDPPCVAVSVRKATHTYGNLMEHKEFTVSVPSAEHVGAADYFGIVSGRDTDKLGTVGLTPSRSTVVNAPYVEEFPLVLECRVVNIAELGLHTQFVGQILDVKVDEDCLDESGKISAELLRPFSWAPIDNHYYGLGERLGRGFSVGKVFEQNS